MFYSKNTLESKPIDLIFYFKPATFYFENKFYTTSSVSSAVSASEDSSASSTLNFSSCSSSPVKYGNTSKIGDSVIVDNPRDGYRVFGTILKIKRTKAEIDMDGVKWNVPITAMRHSS